MTDAERLALLSQTASAIPQILAEGGQKPTMQEYAERARSKLSQNPRLTPEVVELMVEQDVEGRFPDATQAEINEVLKLELID